jgi:TrmH family RNA methyltransferase
MQRITSRLNPRLRAAERLLTSARDRRKSRKCVLEGEHLVGVYSARRGAPETLIVAEDFLARPAALALAERHADRTLIVPTGLFAELAVLPAGVGMIAVVPVPPPPAAAPTDFCVLLDDVQDPGNVGSILRSAAAAGVTLALLSKHCAFAWSPKVLRAAMGAHFHLGIAEDVDLPAWARGYTAAGGELVATVVEGGIPLFDAPMRARVAVALGNEGAGLSPALAATATLRATIPMPGGMESINAAAAAAVCLFEVVRRRGGTAS